jgi:nicotinamide mononucleotide transporter
VITPLEIAANLTVTASIILAGRNSLHTWWTGIVGCLLFMVVFFQAQLYADVILQVFFIATSASGWWQWVRGKKGEMLAVTRASKQILLWSTFVGMAAAICYGGLLHRFTNAYAPYVDSAVLVFSIIAQWLLMQRRVENWPFWLLVNTVAVPLYASRGLYLTAVLYAVYWVNAVISWRHWNNLMQEPAVAELGDDFA